MFKKKITKQSLAELAKVMPVVPEWEMVTMIGGTGGYVTRGQTIDNPYSESEMNSMMDSGTWKGGYVEGLGWVSTGVAVFNGSGNYYTFSDYVRSNIGNAFLNTVIGALPGIGDYLGYINAKYSNLHTNIHAELLDKGYDKSSSFYVVAEDGRSNSNAIIVKVYDAHNGNLILTKSMGIF